MNEQEEKLKDSGEDNQHDVAQDVEENKDKLEETIEEGRISIDRVRESQHHERYYDTHMQAPDPWPDPPEKEEEIGGS